MADYTIPLGKHQYAGAAAQRRDTGNSTNQQVPASAQASLEDRLGPRCTTRQPQGTEQLARAPGTYVLLIELLQTRKVVVGSLGLLNFPRGYYLYTGSALGGLRGRVQHHLRRAKRAHWHIDYLLQYAQILEVWAMAGSEHAECLMAERLANLAGVVPCQRGFGSSDCRCETHLFYSAMRPTVSMLGLGELAVYVPDSSLPQGLA